MRQIFKHELQINGRIEKIDCVSVLSAIEQDGKLMIYVINDPQRNTPHFFHVLGTGWETNVVDGMKFLGTVKCDPFVWHVFYRTKAV